MNTKKLTYQTSHQIHRIVSAGCIIILTYLLALAVNTVNAATYYLDASKTKSGNGTSWATAFKTIADAQTILNARPNNGSGDIVEVNSGNYGSYIEANIARTNWLTYKAAAGRTPVLNKIDIQNTAKINTYLKLDGFKVQAPVPNPMPADDGNWHSGSRMLTLYKANYVNISNCNFVGYNKYLTTGQDVRFCDYFTYYHNRQQKTRNGILVKDSISPTITYNYISEMSEGSGISIYTGCPNANVSYNHVFGMYTHQDEPYFPHNAVGTENYHPGSIMSIRSSPITIRNNILHDGGSQGIMFYNEYPLTYSDVKFENNLIYNTGFYDGITTYIGQNKFYNLNPSAEHPIVFRNNTFIGKVVSSKLDKYSLLGRYYGATVVFSRNTPSPYTARFVENNNGTGFTFINNIVLGPYPLPPPNDDILNKYIENNNIFWASPNYSDQYKLGANTIYAVWRTGSPSYALQGNPCYFEDLGTSCSATTQWSYAKNGYKPFFVNGGFCFGSAGSFADRDADRSGKLDFHLAESSPGVNSGTPDNQPADSLGAIGSDGFIRNDGPSRNTEYHSIGCYEYAPSSPNNLSFAPIGNKEVDEGSTLTFTVNVNDPDIKTFIERHNLPSEPDFADNIFNWTPAYNDAGSYEATFAAENDMFRDFETISIIVNNVNRSPVLAAIGDKSVNENSLLNFLVNATDPDGDSITYSAENLPSGATFTGQTFDWTPDYDQAGTYQVMFAATDGQAQDSQAVNLIVNDITIAPSLFLNENFNNGTFARWSIIDEGTKAGPSSWSASTGTMVQKSNIYTESFPSQPGTYALYKTGATWTNYKVSLTMKSTDSESIGVMFRYKDKNNYYRFAWDKNRKQQQLVKKCNGSFTVLSTKSRIPYVIGRDYQVDIIAKGSTLQVFVDNALILQTTDSSLSSGSIALFSWANAGSYFDNIVVQKI